MKLPARIEIQLGDEKMQYKIPRGIKPRDKAIRTIRSLASNTQGTEALRGQLETLGFGPVSVYRDSPNQPIRLWLVGEYHGEEEHQSREVELIQALKPDSVVHEFLRNASYDSSQHRIAPQPGRTLSFGIVADDLEALPAVLHTCRSVRANIIGCDFSQDEEFEIRRKNSKSGEVFTPAIGKALTSTREALMASVILSNVIASEKPVVAIVGANHSAALHEQKELQDQGFGYVLLQLGEPIEGDWY